MIVRTLQDVMERGSFREKTGVWSSARYLLHEDGVGLTVTDTRVTAGQTQLMEYRNHFEANLVIDGEGTVTELASGAVHELKPGSLYALDKHDRHELHARTDMRIVCVFTPALLGPETHDEHGSYPRLVD